MTKLLALALLAVSTTATAQTLVATDGGGYGRDGGGYARDPMYKQVDGRIGLLLGGSDVGDADGFSTGVSGALGYRLGDVTLRGMVDYYRVGDGGDEAMNRKGRGTRIGGALRYSLAHNSYDAAVGADFWGELGLGYEHVSWRQGGILDRPSGELAVGFDVGGRGVHGASGRRREVGYFMAFRSLLAQGPEMPGVTATCGGPCTEATKPSRTDVSMFFELGVHWGR